MNFLPPIMNCSFPSRQQEALCEHQEFHCKPTPPLPLCMQRMVRCFQNIHFQQPVAWDNEPSSKMEVPNSQCKPYLTLGKGWLHLRLKGKFFFLILWLLFLSSKLQHSLYNINPSLIKSSVPKVITKISVFIHTHVCT